MNILGIVFLAAFIEGLLNYIVGTSDYKTGARPWIKYVALAIGVLLAIAYKLDIPAEAGLNTVYPLVGYVITGIAMGRGSNYINDLATFIQKKAGK